MGNQDFFCHDFFLTAFLSAYIVILPEHDAPFGLQKNFHDS